MPTQCTTDALQFQAVGGRAVRARFDGGALTSDGGAVLLREVDRATASCGGSRAASPTPAIRRG